jgi:hypothetical protein
LKSLNTLVPDIQELFDKGATITQEALSTFEKALSSNLSERFAEYGKGRRATLRLSNVGKPLRQLWFDVASGLEPEPLSPDTKLKFLYGDVLEDLLILLAIEAGHTVTDLQKEVEVDGIKGHIDCVIDGVLVDIKSASTYSWRKFNDRGIVNNDPFGYIGQLSAYHHAMCLDTGGAFLVIDKTLGHLCLCKFSKEELKEYDVRQRIATAKSVLSKNVPPKELCYQPEPDGKSGNLRLPIGCSYCPYKKHCHPGLRTFSYSSGPVYLTRVVKEPNVFEVK